MNPEPVENPTMAAGGFLAIARDDSSLHPYQDIDEMLIGRNGADESTLLLDPHGEDVAVDCFDREGFRLMFEVNGQGRPMSALRTAEEPAEQALTQRIASVIGQGRARLQGVQNDDLPNVLLILDQFAGQTYAEIFDVLLSVPFGHRLPDDPNDRDWVHNCFTHSRCF